MSKNVQKFLGMINYLGSYVKNLSNETEILRNLLKTTLLGNGIVIIRKFLIHLSQQSQNTYISKL